ncbi:MAG: bifunctional protein-serine/threonine kinase/phosphatase [Arenicella sp.]|nr:bifunctional protein-serine/threonine kinase/phosphatase [Arenicella sp.]
MKKKLHLEFGGYSNAGVKASNEDAFTAVMPDKHSVRKFKGGAACIADGVSCSENAKLASQTAVNNFAIDYFSTPDFWTVEQSASKVIGSINSWLYQQGAQKHTRVDGFVTTFSALIIKSHTAHILHVGDSRIYLLRDNKLELITHDHTYQKGDQSYLTRALGIESSLNLDYRSLSIKLNDRYLLTTDGVHDSLTHDELEALANTQADNIEELAKNIGQTALKNGSTDNISCLLVDVASLPIERLEEVYNDLTKLTIPPVLKKGNKIDQFEITRVLHSGTRSHAYLARDTLSDEQRVLKMPSLNFADDLGYLDSFAREQWIGRKLSHPRIMKILAPPRNTDFLYHVCEFVEGKTLRQWMIDNPQPGLDEVRNLVDEMITATRVLHRDKMVHRDLKPENFIINRDGNITLIDLGTVQVSGIKEISKLDLDDVPVGDIGYIAPEYLIHNAATGLSDMFSIASIAYEMLTGKLPFNTIKSNRDYRKTFKDWQYTPLSSYNKNRNDIPGWLDNVLKKALSAKPENRYQVMSEFQKDLRTPSQDILTPSKYVPLLERNPLRFWQGVSAILVLIIVTQWVVH